MTECVRCEACGHPIRHTWQQHAERFIEDVEDLLSLGVDPQEIVRRFGPSGDAIGHRLKRWGRADLAAHFWPIAWQERNQRRAA